MKWGWIKQAQVSPPIPYPTLVRRFGTYTHRNRTQTYKCPLPCEAQSLSCGTATFLIVWGESSTSIGFSRLSYSLVTGYSGSRTLSPYQPLYLYRPHRPHWPLLAPTTGTISPIGPVGLSAPCRLRPAPLDHMGLHWSLSAPLFKSVHGVFHAQVYQTNIHIIVNQ